MDLSLILIIIFHLIQVSLNLPTEAHSFSGSQADLNARLRPQEEPFPPRQGGTVQVPQHQEAEQGDPGDCHHIRVPFSF